MLSCNIGDYLTKRQSESYNNSIYDIFLVISSCECEMKHKQNLTKKIRAFFHETTSHFCFIISFSLPWTLFLSSLGSINFFQLVTGKVTVMKSLYFFFQKKMFFLESSSVLIGNNVKYFSNVYVPVSLDFVYVSNLAKVKVNS